jgi:hypothetical protein
MYIYVYIYIYMCVCVCVCVCVQVTADIRTFKRTCERAYESKIGKL